MSSTTTRTSSRQQGAGIRGLYTENQQQQKASKSGRNRLAALCTCLLLGEHADVVAWHSVGPLRRSHSRTDPIQHFCASPLNICSPRLTEKLHGKENVKRLKYAVGSFTGTLFSTRDDDDTVDFPELLQEEDDPSMSAASIDENDGYVTEAALAEQANDVLLRTDGSFVELQTELSNSFLQYALSIILGRAIPDARDGLKPVHRRILFAMHELQLTSSTSHRKCARVVGDVLGKYHPHGDTAVYDALVRLAQDFTTNHPLVDGHGNFGSIDNDPAAAMRYTECRLTLLSQTALLADLSEDTVDQTATFDGTATEPVVLPAQLPILLLNGAAGIAVGMATNIPPHNLRELMTACIALTNARVSGTIVTVDELLEMVPAPDFPTGACIMGTTSAKQLYTTGNGGIIQRAVTKLEQISVAGSKHATRTAIIVTELPYQVNKAAMLEKIAALVNDKKLEGISDLRDESSGREGIRVVIELKRDAVVDVVLANLYQKTALQTSFAGNLVALMKPDRADGTSGENLVPQRFTLRQALDCFLDFRFETIRRKTRYQLARVVARAHIVDGLLVALEKIDKVIEIVRSATNAQLARTQLKEELLAASNEQADAILRLQLGQLTRLNKGKLVEERSELNESEERLTRLLQLDEVVYTSMVAEFSELSKKFGVDRKTAIFADDVGTFGEIDLIRNSRSVIVVTRGGYVKRMPLNDFESRGRGTRGSRGTSSTGASSTSDDNEVAHCFTCNDHDTLLMVTDAGVAYGIRAYQIPASSRTARGQPFPQLLPQLKMGEVVTAILPVSEFNVPDEFLILATEHGWIKKTPLVAFEHLNSRGLIIAKLEPGDRLKWCQRCLDGSDILVGSSMGMATRFEASSLRPTARGSRGVRTMKLREGDRISDVNVVRGSQATKSMIVDNAENAAPEFVLAVSSRGFGKRLLTKDFRTQARGGVGVVALKFKKTAAGRDDSMTCLRAVRETDEIMVITTKGIMVRQQVSVIPSQGRAATGVLIQKLDEGDQISSVSVVPEYDEID